MLKRALSAIVLGLITGYRWFVSPYIAGGCRFHPSCSAYAEEAVRRHGPLSGGWLTLKRLLRCHPFGRHGFDPVPDQMFGGKCSTRGHQHP